MLPITRLQLLLDNQSLYFLSSQWARMGFEPRISGFESDQSTIELTNYLLTFLFTVRTPPPKTVEIVKIAQDSERRLTGDIGGSTSLSRMHVSRASVSWQCWFPEFTYPDFKNRPEFHSLRILDPGPSIWWIRPAFSWDKWILDKDMVQNVVFGIITFRIKT